MKKDSGNDNAGLSTNVNTDVISKSSSDVLDVHVDSDSAYVHMY